MTLGQYEATRPHRSPRKIRAVVLAGFVAWALTTAAPAAEVTKNASVPEAPSDQTVAVFIREARFMGSGRTMFVYADDQFVGTLDNGTWTWALLPPGDHLLWLNWAKVSLETTVEAGKIYYYNIPFSGFVQVDEATGKALIAASKGHASPTPKEEKTAQDQIRERYGKAQEVAAKAPAVRPATGKGERERHVAKWPKADLTAYHVLYVEDFVMADPKAAERKSEALVETAPGRLASMVVQNLANGPFEEVERGTPQEGSPDTLILRGKITQYKPGSAAGRFLIAGAGAARMDFSVELVDAVSGEQLATFADERSYGWGGAMGAAGGIESIEQNLAYELMLYLQQCKGERP